MNVCQVSIDTLRRKLSRMTQAQLEHAVQMLIDDVVRYEKAITNYPPERMMAHAEPYLKLLRDKVTIAQSFMKRTMPDIITVDFRDLDVAEKSQQGLVVTFIDGTSKTVTDPADIKAVMQQVQRQQVS